MGLLGASGTQEIHAYDHLETVVLPSTNTTTIAFSNLGNYSQYTHLQFRASVKESANNFADATCQIRLNGDTGANYYRVAFVTGGASFTRVNQSNQTAMLLPEALPDGGRGSTTYGWIIADLLNFSSGNRKTLTTNHGIGHSGALTNQFSGYLWDNTSAVTSISFATSNSNFAAGSRISVYGIRA